MTFAHRACRIPAMLAAVAIVAFSHSASAQEISESHLKAARAAVDAINATDQYDMILPAAAQGLKTELIQKNPDLEKLITATVDEQTLTMAARRTDLERESALAYARVFSEDDLNEIAKFYTSPAGMKLLSDGPIVTRELIKAAEIWQRGVARDLAQAVGEQIGKTLSTQPPLEIPAQDGSQATPPLPATEGTVPGTAPAPEGSSN